MKKIKLGDVCKINLNSYSVANDNYKFVNYLDTSNITQNEIATIQKINLESEILPSRAKRKVKTDSIIYSTVRPNQKHFGIIKSQPKNFLVSTGFAVLDVISEKIDANFLFYQLSQEKIIQHLQSIAEQSMTSYPAIRPDDLKNLEIDLPPLEVQKQIGNFLYSLDKKISLNKKINATLEEMAKTIYDYYFVQFDFSDENGKPYKSSGGKMIFSPELQREIPEGWEVKTLSDFGNLKNGINYEKNTVGDKIFKIVNVKNISDSKFSILTETLDDINLPSKNAKNYLTTEEDILIARSGTPGAVRVITGKNKSVIFCGFIICLKLNDEISKNYLMFTLQKNYEIIAVKSTGTILQNITQDTLKNFLFVTPPTKILEKFNAKVEPIILKINKNLQENNLLENLRDFLLPMLMNGQVTFAKED